RSDAAIETPTRSHWERAFMLRLRGVGPGVRRCIPAVAHFPSTPDVPQPSSYFSADWLSSPIPLRSIHGQSAIPFRPAPPQPGTRRSIGADEEKLGNGYQYSSIRTLF